jgi:hypothetical protein
VQRRDSEMHLVDLAGSERCGSAGVSGVDGDGGSGETTFINGSLLAFGKVFAALHDRQQQQHKQTHIPFRDATLTRVLEVSKLCRATLTVAAPVSNVITVALVAVVAAVPDKGREGCAHLQRRSAAVVISRYVALPCDACGTATRPSLPLSLSLSCRRLEHAQVCQRRWTLLYDGTIEWRW